MDFSAANAGTAIVATDDAAIANDIIFLFFIFLFPPNNLYISLS